MSNYPYGVTDDHPYFTDESEPDDETLERLYGRPEDEEE